MEYKDIWNGICFSISHKNKTTSERNFQIIAEFLFEKLGWLQYKGEIITQESIPVGSSKSVKPDIIIKNNERMLFVVELKKPNITISDRNAEQLFSYMRLLKLNFGILLGETLQVYYDLPNDNNQPVKINEILFNEDSDEGISFIRLLSKNEFSFEKLQKYCEEKLAALEKTETIRKYIRLLCSEKGTGIIIDLLKEKLSTKYSEEIAASIIDEIDIRISQKGIGPIPPGEPGGNKHGSGTGGVGGPGPALSDKKLQKLLEKKAKEIVMQNYGVFLERSNTMYSSINATFPPQWSFNRDNRYFDNDTHMILLDQHKKELHYFFIERGKIINPAETFPQRNDGRVQNRSIIIIEVSAYNFKEKNTGFPFGEYKKATIPCKELMDIP